MMATASNQSGATLVETVIAIALMAIALVPLTMTVAFTAGHSADSMIEVRIFELGQAYMEEILSKRFDENSAAGGSPPCSASTIACGAIGPETGESRSTFDDVDDYNGMSDSPPTDSLGNVRAGYDRFRVDVTVAYATVAEVASYNLDSTTDLKRIQVQVFPPDGTPIEFEVYRGNF